MRRTFALLALVVVAVAALAGGRAAQAADECRGLQTCLPVTGPWVAIPAAPGGEPSTVVWELRCPLRGYIVAGIDARVSDRSIDVSIRGENGAPVSPGVTTGRAVVFTAVYTGGVSKPTSFQPFIGCIPTSGGGARGETALRHPAAYVPAAAIDRRVVHKRLVSGASVKVIGRCPAGTRLLGTSHAYAFRSRTAPGTTLLRAVRVRSTVVGRTVTAVAAVAPAVPQSLPVELQLHALCSRGTR
ncbi:MAG TPA: hypothetical protein VHR46_11815 [Gaiella sp.]|nr:hypothetical protein [Gaiella sp.]